ncbi:uncharacterized protein EI97DRAFT_459990 [Westerdykella ornata]|uniref:Uncharacterized protein n=1 Tax=Westerdykella ornata TaxID=318751 RepID=A0A6A6JEJ6_WESOR|nr:uncharacterized protein EI97DRAFT_459990 [Westerdykella ornata]KAF2274717.1 hypothetical protein EI97DRAFT_459990 [Westerdykella ornata]
MAGDSGLRPMPMSPGQSPVEVLGAGIAWARSRRGRTLIFGAVFVVVTLAVVGLGNADSLSTARQHLSSSSSSSTYWHPHLPSIPSSLTNSPLRPSNTTLQLENGQLEHPPSNLHKATPNFHLLLAAQQDSPEFCKTTLSAMILNYPPATIINLFRKFDSEKERERARVRGILQFLENGRVVGDEDLVLIADGQDTWFQLPGEVVVRLYRVVVEEANERLVEEYGRDERGVQRYRQRIVFGARKTCEGDEEESLACKYAPESPLPENLYGKDTEKEKELSRARYLDSGLMMGPAKDLRALYQAAVKKFDEADSTMDSAQSVFATLFAEQQRSRGAPIPKTVPKKNPGWLSWFTAGGEDSSSPNNNLNPVAPSEVPGHEFSMGLDYTNTLFQSLLHPADNELVPLKHDKSSTAAELSQLHRPDTATPSLDLPPALAHAKPPFWTPDFTSSNPAIPTPNADVPFIEPLTLRKDLDTMEPKDTPWTAVKLIQNTYTGSIPAILHLDKKTAPLRKRNRPTRRSNPSSPSHPAARDTAAAAATGLSWSSLWYSGSERALLRSYLRTPQSQLGFHNAAIGGDYMWDLRGGRGGVWLADPEVWLPWGEFDGVCGSVEQMRRVLGADGKGFWLHEGEDGAEDDRRRMEGLLVEEIREEERKAKEEWRRVPEKGGGVERVLWEKRVAGRVRDKVEAERRERVRKEKEDREKERKEKEKEKQRGKEKGGG